ncbi:unnamed protein product [Schistosoma margrebowiei]|uniref:Uncharacterized protein n=1 Tax=Schistosoma margrebowiei TaxID=48269 RepID=A0A183LM68_9TREM|nr:unnamed protein product [Schistosoma margrebowiei]
MMVECNQQETLNPSFVLFGTLQHGLSVILRELVLPDEFDPVSPNFTMSRIDVSVIFGIFKGCEKEKGQKNTLRQETEADMQRMNNNLKDPGRIAQERV